LKFSLRAARDCTSNSCGSRPRRARWMRKISLRSGSDGKSTKKISSRRPLRINSGGSWEMSLAVATTNTGASFSESQVRKVPNTEHENALGRGQTERARLVRERQRPLLKPLLEDRHSADIGKRFVRRVILQQPAFADDLLLLGKNLVHILAAQPLVFDDDLGE